MSNIAIRVEGLGKKYRLGATAPGYKTMRESLMSVGSAPLRAVSSLSRRSIISSNQRQRPDFWAVKDVNFDVKHGEVLGIIGHNGAGKSTLLKLLSQITEPTQGRIGVNGRIAALLEVGTGFHPELTGRENVLLNGAILGMSRIEIIRKFDEIVAFAEVQRFIDTPVKHYSSGMYLRLAFSVSAHLKPEILIVDEVLAVGDAAFQKKCLGKMDDVAKEGRTVLFVSHNMGAIATLCDGAMVMDRGSVLYRGNTSEAISQYANLVGDDLGLSRDLHEWRNRSGSGQARIVWGGVSWEGESERLSCVTMGDTLLIQFDVERNIAISPSDLRLALVVSTITGTPVFHISNEDDNFVFPDKDRDRISVRLPRIALFPGTYTVSFWVGNLHYDNYDYVRDCLRFEVVQGKVPTRGNTMDWNNGLVCPASDWSVEQHL